MTWIIESLVFVQAIDHIHFRISQVEIEDGHVFNDTLNLAWFGNSNSSSLNSPSKQNLLGWLRVASCDLSNLSQVARALLSISHIEFHVGGRGQVAEGHHLDFFLSSHPQEFLLSIVGMHFDLKNSRSNCGIVENLSDGSCANVAETNITNESLSNEGFHRLPSLLVRYTWV